MLRFYAAVLRLIVGLVSVWLRRVCLFVWPPPDTCTVTIGPGKVRGVVARDARGLHYHYFKGIPYAVPPVGDLRFKSPVALESFRRPVLDCFVEGSKCLQYDQFLGMLTGSEDGLFLNVYTPELPGDSAATTEPLPVMVYIHGGGFMCGSGDSFLYDPVHFLRHRVVVVTFNYRLGPLGFLCLPEAGIEGNAGLQDQLLVLRWVRDNIAAFGGDPHRVTLFGESAGAKATYLHYLSPVSRKYFHRAICQSGVVCSDLALQVKPSDKARKLAKCLGYRGSVDSEAIDVLRKARAADLLHYQMRTLDESELHQELKYPFRPVIERNHPEAIITAHPAEALRRSGVLEPPIPLITGCNSGEGMAALVMAKRQLAQYNAHPERLLPASLRLAAATPAEAIGLGERVKKFYFADRPIGSGTLPELTDLLSDNEYLTATVAAAELMSRYQPRVDHYCYYFSFDGRYGNTKQLINMSGQLAGRVCHGDDVFYMFHSALNRSSLPDGADENQVRKRFVKLWTNFARHGNPTPDGCRMLEEQDGRDGVNDLLPVWVPVAVSQKEAFRLDCLQIDRTLQMVSDPFARRATFWRELFRAHGCGSGGRCPFPLDATTNG